MSDGIIFHVLFLIYLTLYIFLLVILNLFLLFHSWLPVCLLDTTLLSIEQCVRNPSSPGAWFWTGAATKAK